MNKEVDAVSGFANHLVDKTGDTITGTASALSMPVAIGLGGAALVAVMLLSRK